MNETKRRRVAVVGRIEKMRASQKKTRVFRYALEGDEFEVVPVSTGNPHSVSFVPDVQKLDLNRIGPLACLYSRRAEA